MQFSSRAGLSLLLLVAMALPAVAGQLVSRNLPDAVTRLEPVDRLPASQHLKLAISLPLRNKEALTNLLQELYDPASPQFHQFLTSTQFAEMFGPAEKDYQAVASFAAAHNLKVISTAPNRAVLGLDASVSDIEQALHVKMRFYKHPTEARTFYMADGDPQLDLDVPILAIHGLNNYIQPFPKYHKLAFPAEGKAAPRAGSGLGGTYLGYDFRDAYMPGVQLTGAGQTVALFELDGYFPNDPVQYATLAGLPSIPLQNVLLDGFNGAPGFANVEVSLDIEMAMAMAPGLSQITVYEGFIPLDIINRIATDNLAKQISCSWGWFPFDPATDQAFQQMGVQGQSFYDASGDSCAMLPPIFPPSDDPYITQVGGTTLTTTGPGGSWVSDVVWNWGGGVGSSGGISGTYTIPTWQQGIDMTTNGGSTTFRNFPDVALTADNIEIVADDGLTEDVGGTSAAAPLWAGFTALVNQQAVQGGRRTMGFINPALYNIGKSVNYTANFHDVTLGNNTNFISTNAYYACPGYDLCTGWGTPFGSNLINTLTPPVTAPVFEDVTNIVFGGNGNGIIDYDECNDLTIILVNGGAANATGVSATLFSSTPGVAIAQNSSQYPDMPIGATGTNQTAFKISTSTAFNCGVPIHFTLIVKCNQTTAAIHFTMSSGVPGAPVRFDNSVPVVIPELGTTNSTIVVSNISFALNKVTVSMFLSDYYDQSMAVQLISPDGTTNTLTANNGASGSDYGIACSPDSQRCTFDDAAATPIGSGAAPFEGSYQPQTPLNVFAGKAGTNLNGTWTLQVQDQLGTIGSVLECWSLFVTPTACADGGGECPGADLAIGMTASPQPVTQGNNLTYSIAVTNLGPSSASNVVVSQILPGSVTYLSGSSSQGTVSPGPGLVTANLGLMRPGATATITIIVNTTTAGNIAAIATVTSEQTDPNPANNIALVVTVVTPPTADLAVSIAGNPSSTVVGGALSFNVGVVNNGPNDATLVTVTNILPVGMDVLNATVSQGALSISSNLVTCTLGTILSGHQATAVISVVPTLQGTFVASASASAAQPDPVLANNTSSTTVVIGPAADLALGMIGYPNPVIVGSNLNYIVSVTNLGPSVASGATMTLTLPTGVSLVSKSSSQGTIGNSGNVVTANLGGLNLGAVATINVVVTASGSGLLTATANVTSAIADPNLSNNGITNVTTAALPFVSIVPAGARLTSGNGPANGVVNPGETVSMQFSLENVGNVPNTNLVVTLLATNGVTPSGSITQTYGILPPISVPGASPAARVFNFTAASTGSGVTAVLSLQDVDSVHHITNQLGYASYAFAFPTVTNIANTNQILIPNPALNTYQYGYGPATPYPSAITVAGITNLVSDVSITLSNLYHTYPHDVSVLIVGPGGQSALVMSHAGTEIATNLTLTFDDSAPNGSLPSDALSSGVWQPTAYSPAPVFSNPAPVGPYTSDLSVFNGLNPNGTWLLYALDDSEGDVGGIANGWSMAITTLTPINQTANLAVSGTANPNPCVAGANLTYVFSITNGGPNSVSFVGFTNMLPPGVSLVSASSSQGQLGTNAAGVFGNLSSLATGATATVTVVVTPGVSAVGTLTNIATVTNAPGVLNLNNAGATAVVSSTVVRPVADMGVGITASTNSLLAGSNLTYTISVTNAGPQNALNVTAMVTNNPSGGLGNINVTGILGAPGATWSDNFNTLIFNLGTLTPGSNAIITMVGTPLSAGSLIAVASVSTASSDTNMPNNMASATVTVLKPTPNVVAAGARIVSKSVGANNGAVGTNDTLTMDLSLQNTGSANTTNLTATLLGGNGVVLSSGPQSKTYGALLYGGAAGSNNFTFSTSGTNGGSVTATLLLNDNGDTNFAPVSFTFYMPATLTFSNAGVITIPDHGKGSPYGSTTVVNVTNPGGGTGVVTKATATIYRYAHTFPHDVSALLADPSGGNVLLMAHTGGGDAVNGVDLTFDDAAGMTLPNETQISNGTYMPTAYGPTNLPAPAATQPYGSALAGLDGLNPNGTWSLYVYDDKPGDAGEIAGGWSLTLSVIYPLNPMPAVLSGLVSSGHFHLTLAGQPNSTYVVEAATNLNAATWVPISTNVSPASGTISIVDSNVFKYRFYRAVQVTH